MGLKIKDFHRMGRIKPAYRLFRIDPGAWAPGAWAGVLIAASLAGFGLFGPPLTSEARAAAKAVVTDIRVGQTEGATRFVFDLSGRVPFKVFTLENPNRAVVDLPEIGWRLPPRPLPSRTGVLDKLRYGLFKPGASRVVLDLNGPARVKKAFMLEPRDGKGYRLVIDLVGGGQAAAPAPRQRTAALTPPPVRKPVKLIPPAPPAKPVELAAAPTSALAARPLPPPLRKPKAKPGAKRVIALDPGHGGVDPGTLGIKGTREKNITLALARDLKRELEKTGRYRVILTRSRDIFVRLRDRVRAAREAGAELFVSIHADAIQDRNIRGLSVYTLSEKASDKEAAALADKENKSDLIAGIDLTGETPEVTDILIDLAQRESMNQSARFAAILVKRLRRVTKILRNTHRFAGFAVLKAPDVPSVLLEAGFLSNKFDERNLQSAKYRTKMAAAFKGAVNGYFAEVEEAYRR